MRSFESNDLKNPSSTKSYANVQQLLSGWTPVVKLFTIKNCAIKALWTIFTICMIIALISSVSVVIHKYMNFVTVVRLDQRGPKDSVIPPAITICLVENQIEHISKKFYDYDKLNRNIVPGKQRIDCKPNLKLVWDSAKDAVSNIYNFTVDFKVTFRTQPPGCYSLSVIEQVPNPSSEFICTTFQLNQGVQNSSSFWKIFLTQLHLTKPNQTLMYRPLLIVHESNSFPFDNYGRYFYEYIDPGKSINIFYSKIITKRLNTYKKPCGLEKISILDYTYDYDQITCQWQTVCKFYHEKCNCLCPIELIEQQYRLHHQSDQSQQLKVQCPTKCQVAYPIALINSTMCPQSCQTITYKKLNVVQDQISDKASIQLELIQAEGLTEMTEEALYSLAKLFGEIGGLSSFCFGFSCIVIFELFEWNLWMYHCRQLWGKLKAKSNQVKLKAKSSNVGAKHIKERNRIQLNPIANCHVDGIRLSEYPKDDGSPLIGLKRKQRIHEVQVLLGHRRFVVPIETELCSHA